MNRIFKVFSPLAIGAVMLTTGCAITPHTAPATAPTTMGTTVATTAPVEDLTLSGTETIVFLRHGEKPAKGLGQLTPQGFNRAIALSTVLPEMYGKPDYLFAPNPEATRVSEGGSAYYYVRPLATIEPTAILLGMPVQTICGFAQIDILNAELTSAKYAGATIFVAWEHGYEAKATVKLIKQFGGDVKQVPPWHGKDYDSLYVVRIIHVPGKKPTVAFTLDHEGLDHLGTTMPVAVPSTQPVTPPSTRP